MNIYEANKTHSEVLDAIALLFSQNVIARDTFKDLLDNAAERYKEIIDEVFNA